MQKVRLGLAAWAALVTFLGLAVNLSSGADDWVLHVPEGKLSADAVADLHDLDHLGEVIPETNLFHFKQKAKRRKRSLQELQDQFEANPTVNAHYVQDQSLSRSKRIPLPEYEEDHIEHRLEKRQSAPVRSTGNQICFVNTIQTDTKESKRCIFPFSFKGKTYVQCTSDHSSNGAEWCATQVDADGEVINKQWGDCDTKSLSCLTLEAGSLGQSVPQQSRPTAPQRPSAPRRPAPPPRIPSSSGNFALPPGFQGQGQNFQPRFPPQGLPQGFPPGFNPQQFQQVPQQFAQRPQQQGRAPFQGGFIPQQGSNGLPGQSSKLPPQFSQSINGDAILKSLGLLGLGPPGANRPPASSEPEWPKADLTQFKTYLNDEAWPSMWYLNRGGRGLDMNVEDAWAQGITGNGVTVSILDDGVEWDHPDLNENYDKEASIDLNDNDDDPYPRYDVINSNKHGTRCAGTVAARANNSDCAVGVAYNAKIGGVRILDGNIIDALEAKAISYNRDHIDIYSASWGPDDDGQTVDGPGPLAKLALAAGALKGRKGKGSIFVWASGNGGKHFDNCNCDGYATSIYTFSVSSASEKGNIPWYSEPCSSSLVTTFSSGSTNPKDKERKVVTTDLHGKCTARHTGTSASSPMAAGIVALALEANPNLTWRDVQHIAVRTAIPRGLLKANDWANNSVGLEFSHNFGFGLMDAGSMVRLAKVWNTVPEPKQCKTEPGASGINKNKPLIVRGGTEETINLDASGCGDGIKFLEHIHLNIDATSGSSRGTLSVMIRSPEGTVSILLGPRPKDTVPTGFGRFANWPMMSVHFWGEPVVSPVYGGVWSMTINNAGSRPCILNDWGLTFYGTSIDPQPGVSMRPVFMPFPRPPVVFVPQAGNDEDSSNDGEVTPPGDEVLDDDVETVDPENPSPTNNSPDEANTRVVEDTTPFSEDFTPEVSESDQLKQEIIDQRVAAFQALLG